MENKTKKSKALIITIIIILVLVLAGFLIYKNRDAFGVKTSASIAKIFSPLVTSENQKRSLIQAGEDIKKGDGVTAFGNSDDGKTKIVRKAKSGDTILGYADEDISYGDLGNVTLSDGSNNSFWDSFSNLFNNSNLAECSDRKDNDRDGLVDTLDPSCHVDGDITKDYLPNHYSELNPPVSSNFGMIDPACSDKIDNDKDEKIDNLDPNCHIDGDLEKAYVPTHYSETTSPLEGDGIGADLISGNVYPVSTIVNTQTKLSSVITNIGTASTKKSFFSFLTITSDKNKTQSNLTEDVEVSAIVPTLEAGTGGTASVDYTFKKTGTYYLRICADKKSSADEGTLTELSEDNNCGGWTTFTVTSSLPPDGYKAECSDEADNDSDTFIDTLDPNCHLDGNLAKDYMPDHNSESVAPVDPLNIKPQCSDNVDNDKDGTSDKYDTNCHKDNIIDNEYLPDHDSESVAAYSDENICLDFEQNPITFTDEEKAKLAELLRKFYLLASTLHSEEDIEMIYNEIARYENLSDELNSLTEACYAQTSDPSYTGTKVRFGNPWFKYDERGSYIERATTQSSCTPGANSSASYNYCSGRASSQFYCENVLKSNPFGIEDFLTGGFSQIFDYGEYKETGCKWNGVIDLQEYEAILNIW